MNSKTCSDLPAVEITTDEAGLLHLAAVTDESVVVSAAGAGGAGD